MEGISLFSYFPAASPVHRFDPRLKLAAMIALSVSIFLSGGSGLLVLTLFAGTAFCISGYPLLEKQNLRRLKGILVLALFILAGRTLFAGTPVFTFTRAALIEGLKDGIIGAWRLLLFASGGLLFTVSTSTVQIRNAISSILKPFPFIPGENIALMMSLTITFVPVIFSKAREVGDVHQARGMGTRKQPIRRIFHFTNHVLTAILRYTDEISEAMESRAYSGERTKPVFTITMSDCVSIVITAAVIAGALFIDGKLPLL